MHQITGRIVDLRNRRIYPGELTIEGDRIAALREISGPVPERYIMPGFTDAHIHIESSMLVPSEFARLAVRHGTVATVSDPHEIANVCGLEGIEFMINNGNTVPLKFFFGAPSCVPATPFETAGAELDAQAVAELLNRDDIHYLAEMMNWPGVLNRDSGVMAKINAAIDRGKPVDGHAPGLRGDLAGHYASAGISTDHECFTLDEALDKINAGMMIIIREGSAARNYDALHPLLGLHPDRVMFCSDDKHPDDLVKGHINLLAARSVAQGYELFDVLTAMCIRPAEHYNLPVGSLQPGDPADFIIVEDLQRFKVEETWIDGRCVYDHGEVNFDRPEVEPVNNFTAYAVSPDDFAVPALKPGAVSELRQVIVAHDGEIVTGAESHTLYTLNGQLQADPERDLLKIAVVNRYEKAPVSVGFIRNFGIRNGAIASSVAHDSHNIIAVGSSDADLSRAVNLIMQERGGIAAVQGNTERVVGLPVAGIMSASPGEEVALGYEELSAMARSMGSSLHAPFMLISFMALLVIPKLKLSDKGMFDGESFRFV